MLRRESEGDVKLTTYAVIRVIQSGLMRKFSGCDAPVDRLFEMRCAMRPEGIEYIRGRKINGFTAKDAKEKRDTQRSSKPSRSSSAFLSVSLRPLR